MSTVLCPVDAIAEDEARGFEVGEQRLFAVRKDGQIQVYMNFCPHLGIELNFQPDDFLDMDKAFIICANHGALFDIETGQCVAGPCSGQSLTRIAHVIEDGQIVLPDL